MSISVLDSDWKFLRQNKEELLERLCGRINQQSQDILNAIAKNSLW